MSTSEFPNLTPWPKGVSGNPAGKLSRKTRHRGIVAELTADLGANLGAVDRALVEQAAWLLVHADDLRRSHKPVSNEDMTRAVNGAARILIRLRETRDHSEVARSLSPWDVGDVDGADVVAAALQQLKGSKDTDAK